MPVIGSPIGSGPNTPQIGKWWVTTAPSARPVEWADAKAHLRLDTDDEQSYVEMLIDAATDYAQDALATSLMPQVITATFDLNDFRAGAEWCGPAGVASPYLGPGLATAALLPRGPVRSVTSAADGNALTFTGWALGRVTGGDLIRLTANVRAYPLTVVYAAGYPAAANIPSGVRLAILMHVGSLYENRESVAQGQRVVVPHNLEAFYRLKSRRVPVG